MTPSKIAMLIPAAGNSSRLGQPKQLVNLAGQPLLMRQIGLCTSVCETVYCVLGAYASRIVQQLKLTQRKPKQPNLKPCHFLTNPNWQQGLAQSIAFGVSQLPGDISAVCIVLGDQWALTEPDLNQLLQHYQSQPDKIHASLYQQQTGVPAIFPRQYFFELSQPCRKNTSQNRSKNSGGAKQLLKRHQHNVITVPMTNAAADLDTPEQLAQLSNDPFYQASICGEPQ